MSLLIEFFKDECGRYSIVTVPHDDDWPDFAYLGAYWPKDKPNFPVPAIPRTVKHGNLVVSIHNGRFTEVAYALCVDGKTRAYYNG